MRADMTINENKKNVGGADLIVYGKIFISENDRIAEAFAVHDGRYVYAGDRNRNFRCGRVKNILPTLYIRYIIGI